MGMSKIETVCVGVIMATAAVATQHITGSQSKILCEGLAARVATSTPTSIFNRCEKELPDGTVLSWDRFSQHKKDLESGVALELK